LKTFSCYCGNSLHFENSQCLACERAVGYLPDEQQLSALEPTDNGQWRALHNNRIYRQCKNYSEYAVCNWMVPIDQQQTYCASCQLSHVIPNLTNPQNITLWYRLELAKRRLLYTLYNLRLPVVGRTQDPHKGLGFEFLEDQPVTGEFGNELSVKNWVMSGHNAGIITINVLEADHGPREEMREKMKERYRTLLGHFRHESGHYYWERLINGTSHIDSFREIFGDERRDYQHALQVYYDQGPPSFWQDICISAYGTSHPWEDWAETWTHYLHMVDTLETAHDFGFSIAGHYVSPPQPDMQMAHGYIRPTTFDELFDDWGRLTVALNALNRSMGMEDAYPFVVSGLLTLQKLQYVHDIISEAGSPAATPH